MEALRETFGGVHWQEYQYLLASGHPPVYLQLILVNALFLVLWIVRRARSAPQRGSRRKQQPESGGGFAMAAVLVLANAGVLMVAQTGS